MARQKRVYNTKEIAHLWAHRSVPEARNQQGNHGFVGGIIRSYAEPIARLVRVKGEDVVLYRNKTWSSTTTRHQRLVQRATSHLPGFHVDSIVGGWGESDKIPHKVNLADYARQIKAKGLKASKARANKTWQLCKLQSLIAEANHYAETFGLHFRFSADVDLEKIAADSQAEAVKDKARREKAKRKLEQKNAEVLAKLKVLLPQWMDGGANKGYNFVALPFTYMRISGNEVETTWGARVPVKHVRRALPIALYWLNKGETFPSTNTPMRLGPYTVTSIKDGVLTAGCHKFERAEVERIAGVIAAIPEKVKA